VHFLLQVDLKKATDKSFSRYADEIRIMTKDKKLYHSGVERRGADIVVPFNEKQYRDQAIKEITRTIDALQLKESEADGKFVLTASVKPESAKAELETALEQNIQTLRKRVNELGVAEPIVQKQGADRIIVEVPGAQDPAKLKDIIGRVATLDVRMVAEEYSAGQGRAAFEAYRSQTPPPGTDRFFDREGGVVLVYKQSVISGERVKNAQPNFDQNGGSVVSMSLDEAGGNMMLRATKDRVGKRMAMMLIEKDQTVVLTWPTIQDVLGYQFQITGMQNQNEAKELSLLLRSGALAAPMEFIEERVVGPSLGADNIKKGFKSVTYGFIAVAVFMIIYYMVFGVVSVLALASNLLFLIAILSVMQATVTLPGIAAIALTLGMAIDSNVLINERIREELRAGLPPAQAVELGYERAFATILDSNVTTLIAGLALLAFGSGAIRGFAVVHCLGILTSLFSAVVVSKGIVHLIYGRQRKLEKISIGNTKWSPPTAPIAPSA
jgi:preprotein translocase subunit SecD